MDQVRISPIFTLLAIFFLILPANAFTYGYTAPTGKAIWGIDFDIPYGSEGTVTVVQNDGTTTQATWTFKNWQIGIGVGGSSDTSNLLIPPVFYKTSLYNDGNETNRLLKYSYGLLSPFWFRTVQAPITRSPIVSYSIDSDVPVTPSVNLVDINWAADQLNTNETDYVAYIISLVSMFVGFVISLVFWVKFFFIDNLLLTVALYIGITGAMSFARTWDIFKALKLFFKYQKTMMEFIISIWTTLISIASYIRGLFKFV